MSFIEKTPRGLIINLRVQPRSSQNMIVGVMGSALKIKLTAPPINDAANRMCLQYLAKKLKVPKSSLQLISGHTARNKQVLFENKDHTLSANELDRIKQRFENLLLPPQKSS